MTQEFLLHPRLEADSLPVASLPLCRVRLMNNARFPWLLLVPALPQKREITDLDEPQQQQLMREIAQASRVLQQLTGAHKMNVATLGNMVPQLHIHIIARFEGDAAWPAPVWGTGGEPYTPEAAATQVARLAEALK
jgi:diadenosine tetraphosphate (Ap4A) HIT family hydrolase